ncbi:MAG: sulfatase-like hydrolase/transferase, partial [Spirochaetales bacterium]|nr:sulfatase-like hydrolase/transferase [Spirochaetales bacterium]
MIKSKNELSVIRMLPSTFLQLMEKFLRVLFDFCCKTPLLKGMAFFLLAFITAAKIEAAPNVIFIVADDMGWHELNCYGNTFNETPNIDQLASDGIRFTNAYAAAAVCSPTRASIMTGQYSFRTGITDYIRAEANASNLILYPRDHVTYNERLNANNYHTTYIGKWHLSSHENNTGMPAQHGWNEVLGSETSAILGGDYWFPYGQISTLPNQTTANGYLTTRQFLITSNCLDRVYTQPFFIQLSLFAVHTELEAPQDLVDKYNNKRAQLGLPAVAYADRNSTPDRNPYLAAMIEVIDNGVGSIVTKLQQLGIADNTIIVFFSDNGGEHGADNNGVTDNGPLREGKRHAYEGGIREPLIIKWPGVVQAGRVSDVPVSSVDFYPTFVEMTGSTLSSEQYLDGKSIVPVLRNSGGIDRDFLIWSKPLAALHKNARSASAIRKGNFKLIEFHDTNTYELYNLANDLSETNNLAGSNPSKRDELANDLHRVIYGEPGSGFTENFNDNNDKGWVKYSGFWNVNNGVYELSSTFAKQKAMAAGTNFSDFTYEADIKLNTANAPGGLLFRTTLPIDGADGQRGYFVGLNTADGVRLVKYNFNSTQLTKTAMTINTGTWYHVKVVAQGSNIKIFVNDMNTPKINFNDSAWSFGAIGLRSYQCSVSYDNICVTAAG